ncbi:hypothetical protein QBC32DRAFT_381968 [Pseudoneurospora amorphoporcata]|uniref:JmjC domain-containing protein n=1 Tax=Pseudoneurospora amorphoporcata TaxID=241081 RepID=A0AAN6SIK1_9PEZI|nr:hypothetical protein QBC32DRAFT_381968 [Pseudoneurospora amorphoporcata]
MKQETSAHTEKVHVRGWAQQFVPAEIQRDQLRGQQEVQLQPEQPVLQQERLQGQHRDHPQAQHEVHLQPNLQPQQHDQHQAQQQGQLQGQQRDQLQGQHEGQLQPQQRDQQQVEQQAQLQGQQETQLQPQQPVHQQVQLQLQQRDRLQGQQEVQLQPQQPLQQHDQLPGHIQGQQRDHLQAQLQDQQQPRQEVPQQAQLHSQQRILPQHQRQDQQRGQQQVQQDQQDHQNQLQYQQQEHRHTEAVPEAVPDAGAGAVDSEESSQPEPPTQDEIHAVGPAPRVTSPTPTTHNIPTNSSTSCGASHDVEVRPGDLAQLPPPKLLLLPKDSAPLFDCTYQDVHVLNEELFEQCSLHPDVQDRGYFKLQIRDLPPLQVAPGKMGKPDQTHATSFFYKKDNLGLVKVDTGKKPRIKWPTFPLPLTEKQNWSLKEQKQLWNSTAAHPPNGARPYIIGNPLFDDIELSPGDKLKRRGQTVLEGINTQYIYFNLKEKTITVMHREDAHVRSENLLRDGENKFWCFVKPSSAAKLEERMRHDFPEMRSCSQAVRHLSRHIPPAKLDEWGVEYTLDYCVPGQAVVTEPGTYHQVLNLGPNYAIAINVEYESSPDDPPNYTYCDEACPDQCAISAEDFCINPDATAKDKLALPAKMKPMAMMAQAKRPGVVSPGRNLSNDSIPSDSAPATDEQREKQHSDSGSPQEQLEDAENHHSRQLESAAPPSIPSTVSTTLHEPPVSNVSEVNPSVIDSGRVDRGPMQVVSEPQQSITESEAPPEVQQTALEVQQVPQKPEVPREVQQPTPVQEEIALLPVQPLSQPVMFVQQQEQTAMVRPGPAILNSVETHGLGRSVAYHQQELQIVQATFPMLQQSTAPPLVATGPAPLFKIPDVRFVGPPVLQPFDGAIQAFDRDFETQTSNAQQPAYGILQPPPALKQNNSPAEIIGSYVHQTSSESPSTLNNAESASGVGIKRPAEIEMQSAVKRTKPDNEEISFGHLADLLRTAKSPPVEHVWSKAAFMRLAGLVRDWREYSRSVSIPGGGFDLLDHIDDAEQISQELHVFLRRFFKMKLSECVESTAQVNSLTGISDRPVSSRIDWGELVRKLNWDVAGRNQLNDYVREGKCWRTICGEYDGLLCLLPSDDRFLELSMFKEQLAHFHAQLSTNAVRSMCAMGQTLEKSIWEYLELPEFAWESVDTSELSLDEISPLLSQFKLVKANHYDRLKYNWGIQPQPLGWTDPWPTDPMSVLKSDKKVCSLCNSSKRMTTEKSSCKCLVKRLPHIPRITEDGSRGAGVRAVGSFKADEFLGELVGELRPPHTTGAPDNYNHHYSTLPNGHAQLNSHDSSRHNYEWTMEVRRPDLQDQVVAEIYPQKMGNWVRKVRHDGVNPSAEFKVMKITGKWRVILVALRDIRDGEEITAKYGRGYRKEQPYEVVEGLH